MVRVSIQSKEEWLELPDLTKLLQQLTQVWNKDITHQVCHALPPLPCTPSPWLTLTLVLGKIRVNLLHKLTLWIINYVTGKDSLDSFCGGFSPGKYTHFELNFEGSFHGVFSMNIIHGPYCKCFQTKQLWVGKQGYNVLSFYVTKTVLVGPRWFWSDQIYLDLTIMIWSQPKWNGHDQN